MARRGIWYHRTFLRSMPRIKTELQMVPQTNGEPSSRIWRSYWNCGSGVRCSLYLLSVLRLINISHIFRPNFHLPRPRYWRRRSALRRVLQDRQNYLRRGFPARPTPKSIIRTPRARPVGGVRMSTRQCQLPSLNEILKRGG